MQQYRLIGYENRLLNNEDFRDDTKDAGEMGAGHTVTILYEIIPAGKSIGMTDDTLRYQRAYAQTGSGRSAELATVKFRYKAPEGNESKEMAHVVPSVAVPVAAASENLRWAASVAMFGMVLRDSKTKGTANYAAAKALARSATGVDPEGYRAGFIRLIDLAAAAKTAKN